MINSIANVFKPDASGMPFYGKASFTRAQIVTGVALMALSAVSTALAAAGLPLVGVFSGTAFHVGSVVVGLALLQQAIMKTPGCTEARTSRAVAGAFLIVMPVLGWIPAAFLWHHSHLANQRA